MDVDFVHAYLTQSYWAAGRTKADVIKSMKNAICFGVFVEKQQVGFARIVTDQVVFAWLMDVFIDEMHQGKGFGKKLIDAILKIPELENVNGVGLRTKDAHGLYRQYGFDAIPDGSTWMLRNKK